jgi:hypothetical protein
MLPTVKALCLQSVIDGPTDAVQINTSTALVVKNGLLVPVAWQYVRVGEIVKVQAHAKLAARMAGSCQQTQARLQICSTYIGGGQQCVSRRLGAAQQRTARRRVLH